jgi:hypothetical protein
VGFSVDLDAPARYQSEPSSTSKSQNCGVTVAAAIADFYTDRRHDIEEGRGLIAGLGPFSLGPGTTVVGAPRDTPTNSWQQAEMLRRWGVPCQVVKFSTVGQLHAIVDSGRRPLLLGLNFEHVNTTVAGHSFGDWHAIKLRTSTTSGGARGFLVNDPNFWPSRPDPTNGRRFYPDAVVQHALAKSGLCAGVVPLVAKPDTSFTEEHEMAILSRIRPDVPRDFTVRAGTVLRRGPGEQYPEHWRVPADEAFRLVGWDIDPQTKAETKWVAASRRDGTGIFFVPPVH